MHRTINDANFGLMVSYIYIQLAIIHKGNYGSLMWR